uniref:acylaminoacyl-peptidase n=1 Tax=Tetranychus truncatus TaxID=93132 RepID=A0A3G5APB7_9ACAR|nr:acylamino-acid-releasing enzyme-like [Tetranychus truncatus]
MSSTNRLIDFCRGIKGKASSNSSVIRSLTEIFKKYGSNPNATKATLSSNSLLPKSYKLRVDWSHTDFESIEKVNFFTEYMVNLKDDGNVDKVIALNNLQDVTDELISVSSLDNQWKAVVREKIGKDKKSSQVIEFWSQKGKVKTLNGDKDKSFGKIHFSSTFGEMSWSRDGSQLMFIADKYKTTSGFFDEQKKNKDNNDESKSDLDEISKPTGQGEEYFLKEDWGEQLEGTCNPIVCIVDRKDDYKIRTIEVPGVSCSEAFWIDDKTIGFVGIMEETRRLGLIFCPIRKSCLYKCDLRDPESEPDCIYGKNIDIALRSPRVSYDSKKIVFLCNPPSGPHYQASSLVVFNMEDSTTKTLINTDSSLPNEIEDPTEIRTLYCLYLPNPCWLSDNKSIIVEASMGYKVHLFYINCETGLNTRIALPGKDVSVLSLLDDLAVVKISEPNCANILQIGKLNTNNNQLALIPIDPNYEVKIDDMEYRCDVLETIDPSTNVKQIVTSILISPKELIDKPSAAILLPHGGPHGNFEASYYSSVAAMVEAGFKLILINYRGSTGLNSAHEKFLCGKIGTTDVEDCIHVLKYYIEKSQIDPKQVFLLGGSHGGFLVTHLIGQHSDFGFKACCAMNPVTDLASGFGTSDIPDWHLVEGIGDLNIYPLNTKPTPELLKELLLKSPIFHIDKVQTPVLMGLGTKDKRVSMSQGLNYYYGLKARQIEAQCLVYEDNHSLSKVAHDLDRSVNTMLWFLDHLSSTSE